MSHHHHKKERKDPGVRKRLKVAFLLNFSFTIIEFIGGIFTNSIAIISDAIHDLGDTVAIGSALWLEKVAERKRDRKYTYGYKRFSTLGALLTILILLIGSIIIIYKAVPRIISPQPVMAMGMMWLAIIGIVFNGIAVLRLRGGNESLNNRAVMLHLMEDVIGWIAILVGSIVISFTGWYWIDPILSLLVAGYILFNVFKNIRSILNVFLQSAPNDFDASELEKKLVLIEGVISVHDMHTWTMDGVYHVLSLHMVVHHEASIEQLKKIRSIANSIVKDFGIHHPTIALEFENEPCENCH